MTPPRRFYLIGGPMGVGKTTAALAALPGRDYEERGYAP